MYLYGITCQMGTAETTHLILEMREKWGEKLTKKVAPKQAQNTILHDDHICFCWCTLVSSMTDSTQYMARSLWHAPTQFVCMSLCMCTTSSVCVFGIHIVMRKSSCSVHRHGHFGISMSWHVDTPHHVSVMCQVKMKRWSGDEIDILNNSQLNILNPATPEI